MFPGVLERHIVNTTGFSQSRSQMSVGGIFLHCAPCTFLAVNSDSCLTLDQNTPGWFQETWLDIHVLFEWTSHSRASSWRNGYPMKAAWLFGLLTWVQDTCPGYGSEYLPCSGLPLCQDSDAPGHWDLSKDQYLTWSNPLHHPWPAECPTARKLRQIAVYHAG